MNKYWPLPDGVDELLPPRAEQVENLRQQLLALFRCWGYKLVSPPLIEFIDALMIGGGDDLMLSTFKMTDQMSGHTLGLRADISSQVARIDASKLLTTGVQRLCYAGSTLLARQPASGTGRCPIKVGAELYGYKGVEADVEIIMLLVQSLVSTHAPAFHVELSHASIFRQLVAPLSLSGEQQAKVFAAVQAKSSSDLEALLLQCKVPSASVRQLSALPSLMGGPEVLSKARHLFAERLPKLQAALDQLEQIAEGLKRRLPSLSLSFDLAELRGYSYHTGVMYTAYVDDLGQSIARGGRYDGLAAAFGRARAATGFDIDLKALAQLQVESSQPGGRTVLAPWSCEPEAESKLTAKIAQLRAKGDFVLFDLPGAAPAEEADNLYLQWRGDSWHVQPS